MTNALSDLMQRRIALLDGAMGTMIQTYKLGEDAYRGSQFKNHDHDLNHEHKHGARPRTRATFAGQARHQLVERAARIEWQQERTQRQEQKHQLRQQELQRTSPQRLWNSFASYGRASVAISSCSPALRATRATFFGSGPRSQDAED